MISVLRKVAQLNIKYRKKEGLIIDVCTGTPPDEVTALISNCVIIKILIQLRKVIGLIKEDESG